MPAPHTPVLFHRGGTFNPDSERPSCNIWGPTPEGKQSGTIVARDVTLADAELIVRCVNSHEALVEALRAQQKAADAKSDWEAWGAKGDASNVNEWVETSHSLNGDYKRLQAEADQLRAAALATQPQP